MTTAAQIQEELEHWNREADICYNVGDSLYEALYMWSLPNDKSFEIPSGTVTPVANKGGGEGDGEERYIVIKVADQFFMYSGYYSSWDGTEWDDRLHEVEPYEVTVTKYRFKKG